ncbi:uncharacterized protein LOC124813769 [Hydra vulgaris]|uniref:uncharacterized protein LOC124813769 n=1 Tax=Hydra vulgaris TaxID=6087 RepID=UPI001F5E6FD0|nr:uncharacterized protein LOC124813769 [Hydra vulgaris]XP_047137210.1 uncharacterized protein LOC124813769 [Hydra vulgaris]
MGKLLTGPWMTNFYVAQSEVDFLSGVEVVKGVRNILIESQKNALSLLNRTTDFFGGCINDPVFDSIVNFSPRTNEMKDAIVCCLSAVVNVIDRQYKRLFNLNTTDKLKAQTLSARLHNIDSEELMGMFSAAKQKAPNATLCFLSAKLRACKNKTTEFLYEKPIEVRNKLILWAISTARKKRFANIQKHEELKIELIKRMAAKLQKKEEKERKNVEKILKNCVPQQIKILFPDLENNEAADIEDIIFGDVIGRNICHMWYDSVTNTQEIYYGRILRLKKNNIGVYIISYWKPKECEDEDAIEYDMNKYQLSADIICGDLALSDDTRSML